MKFYSVDMPVDASVTVIVQATNEAEAEELATRVASLSDAEPIDFSQHQPEVLEIEHKEIPKGSRVWDSRKKYEIK